MKTMEEIDVWYEAQMNQAEVKGEQRQRQSIAIKMIGKNIPLETIAEVTGMTISELEGFANNRLKQVQSTQDDDL